MAKTKKLILLLFVAAQPNFKEWSLDVDASTLVLTFEANSVLSVKPDCSKVTIHSTANGVKNVTLTNSGNGTLDAANDQASCTIDAKDLDNIKLETTLGTNTTNTFLEVKAGFGTKNGTTEFTQGSPYTAAALVTPDVTAPEISATVGFSEFDLNSGRVTIAFTEAVDVSTLKFTKLAFRDAKLTGKTSTTGYCNVTKDGKCDAAFCKNGATVVLEVDNVDLNCIKSKRGLCTKDSDCIITLEEDDFIQDMAGNKLGKYESGTTANAAETLLHKFVPDITSPTLDNFDLDLNANTLTLEFSETVDAKTLKADGLTIQGNGNTADVSLQVKLTSESTTESSDSATIIVDIAPADGAKLKMSTNIATKTGDSYIAVATSAMNDMSGNAVKPISSTAAKQVRRFTNDTSAAVLSKFSLDLNTNQLTLTFDEPVKVDSLNFTLFTLQSTAAGGTEVKLTGSTTMTTGTVREVVVDLSEAALVSIKSNVTVATSLTDTYLTHESSAFKNFIDLLSADLATGKAVDVYTEDSQGPSLTKFSLDMNASTLTLTFDDVVKVSTLKVDRISVQHAATSQTDKKVTLTTKSTSTTSDGFDVTIDLDAADQNTLKSTFGLATGKNDTFLTLRASTVDGVDGNDVVGVTDGRGKQVDVYKSDTTKPKLVSFDFDLDASLLSLTFDESVDKRSFNASRLSIQKSAATIEIDKHTLTGGTVTSIDTTVLDLTLNAADMSAIKENVNLAISNVTTFVTFSAALVKDDTKNSIDGRAGGLAVTKFTKDITAPKLKSFTLDLNTGNVTLSFSETVNGSAMLITSFTLQDEQTASPGNEQVLTSATANPSANSDVLTLDLGEADFNAIRANSKLGTKAANTFMAVKASAIVDMSNNKGDGQEGISAVGGNVKEDVGQPTLSDFSYDHSDNILTLTFDEVVNKSSVTVSSFTLQSKLNGSDSGALKRQLTATSVVTTTENSNIIAVQLGTDDIDDITSQKDFVNNQNDTFLSFSDSAVTDMSGNKVAAIADTNGKIAAAFTADAKAPKLSSFVLNVDTGELRLTFSERVNPSSLNASVISIVDAANSTTVHKLTGGSTNSTEGKVIVVELLKTDLNALKSNGQLATATSNSYVRMLAGVINDVEGIAATSIADSSALQASTYIKDETSPKLESFLLKMSEGKPPLILEMTFDETVDASSLVPTKFTLQQQKNAFDTNFFTLTGGTPSSTDAATVQITLTDNDLANIRGKSPLGADVNNTFISVASGAVSDTSNNTVEMIARAMGLKASAVTADLVQGKLTEFSLDMNEGKLKLTFNEDIDNATLSATNITIHSSTDQTQTPLLKLTGGTAVASPKTVAEITLVASDLDFLKKETRLSTSTNDTYITIEAGAIKDIAGNDVEPNTALKAAAVAEDTSSPKLVSFDFDLNTAKLTLSFSETVDSSSLKGEHFTLQNSASEATTSYSFKSGSSSSFDGTIIEFFVPDSDVNEVKAKTGLAVSELTTFLVLNSDAILDMNGNKVTEITASAAMKVSNFTSDSAGPTLTSFELKMTNGAPPLILELTFDEVVNASTLSPTKFTLQTKANGSITDLFTLTGGKPSVQHAAVVQIEVSDADLVTIRNKWPLGTSVNMTFLSVATGAVKDVVARDVNAIPRTNARKASAITADLVLPKLETFTLDLNTGELKLTFNEDMDASTFDGTRVTIHSSSDATATPLQKLTGGNASTIAGKEVVVKLVTSDLDAVKKETGLGTKTSNTFITVGAGAIKDVAGNEMEERSSLQAMSIGADTTRPSLVSFNLDMDLSIMSLTFDETVDASSLRGQHFTLQPAVIGPADFYKITSGISTSANGTSIDFVIPRSDIDKIKENTNLAISMQTTFLALTEDAISDMSGNKVNEITIIEGKQVTYFTSDQTKPVLNNFDVDLDSGQLLLNFSEIVDERTLTIGKLNLQNKVNNTVSHRLTSSTSTPGSAAVVTIDFSVTDLDEVKRLALCSSKADCFLSFEDSTVKDMAGRAITAIGDDSAVQVNTFTKDTTEPKMSQFSVFDLDNGRLTLLFTESVDVLTLHFTKLSLREARVTTEASETGYYQLTKAAKCEPSFCSSGKTVIIELHEDDLNNIKIRTGLCTKDSDCILTFENEGFVKDIAGNSLPKYPSGRVQNVSETILQTFTPDTTAPVLREFDLDLSTDILTLVFSEAVRAASFKADGLTVQGKNNTNDSSLQIQLSTDSATASSDGISISVSISPGDGAKLKTSNSMATAKNDTFIVVASSAIKDMSENTVAVIPNTDAKQVRQFSKDVSGPSVSDFSLDLNANQLTLTFSEPIKVDSLNFMLFALQSTSTGGRKIQLTSSTTSTIGVVREVTVDLTEAVVVSLKSDASIATGTANSFLTHQASAFKNFRDVDGDVLVTGKQVNVFTPDTTGPSLTKSSLDMNKGELSLTFNDVVSVSTLIAGQITFQHGLTRISSRAVTLTSNSKASTVADGLKVVITLGEEDLNSLKTTTGLASSKSDTYLTMTATTVDGVDGIDVIAITDGKAQQVDVFAEDANRPTLKSFDFDLDGPLLKLTFSEPVNKDSFNSRLLTIQKSAVSPGSDEYTFTAGSVATNADQTVVDLTIAPLDINSITKNVNLAVSNLTTFLTFGAGLVNDTSENSIAVVSMGVQVSTFTDDRTVPSLDSFALDLDSESLILTFSETVKGASLVVTSITVQESKTNPSNKKELTSVTLAPTVNGDVQTLNLGAADINAIRANPSFGTSISNTFTSVEADAIEDMSGNKGTGQEGALSVSGRVFPDSSVPTLSDFTYNLSDNILTLTFSEVVNRSSVVVTSFTLQSKMNSSGFTDLALTSMSTVTTADNSNVIAIKLGAADVDFITSKKDFVNSRNSTYLSFATGAVKDMAGNDIRSVLSTTAMQAKTFISDTKQATVDAFSLDMNVGELVLTFSERVNPTSLTANVMSIVDALTSTQAHKLSGGTTASLEGQEIVVQLSDDDLNAIKANDKLATANSNTFLLMNAGVIRDVEGVDSLAIGNGSAIQATSYTFDTERPTLESFELKMVGGTPPLILELTFSETVNASTLGVTKFTLQSSVVATQINFVTLTGGTPSSANAVTVQISVSAADLASIRSKSPLGTALSNSFLSIASGAVKDMAAQNVQAIAGNDAKQASNITADLIQPKVNEFSLDMDEGKLQLTFNEAMDSITLSSAKMTIHSSSNETSKPLLTLRGGSATVNSSVVAEVTLTRSDLDNLKEETGLATSTNNTYITVESGVMKDLAGNDAEERTALKATSVTEDENRPSLVSFDLDLNSNTLTLTFSEPVDASTLRGEHFKLQNLASSATDSYSFTSGSSVSNDGSTVNLVISSTDMNEVKAKTGLAANTSTTYLVVNSDAILDMNSNKVTPITASNAIQAKSVIPDSTGPKLESFELQMSDGTPPLILALTFDETIDSSTLLPTEFTIQSKASGSGTELATLTGGIPSTKDSATVQIEVSATDLLTIRSKLPLGTTVNSTFLSIASGALKDMSGNNIQAIDPTSAQKAKAITADLVQPKLDEFSLDLNEGQLEMTFNEGIDGATFAGTKVTIHSTSNETKTPLLKLTGGTAVSTENTVAIVSLLAKDLNALKKETGLGTTRSNTYLTVTLGLIKDVAGNELEARTAVKSSSVVNDITSPNLVSFNLDMNSNTMTLSFDETVNSSSLSGQYFTLQNLAGGTTETYTLTSGSSSSADGTKVTFVVAVADINEVKAKTGLAIDKDSTFLSLNPDAILDMGGNTVTEIAVSAAKQVTNFTADSSKPVLVKFDVDLDSGQLTLSFTETMNVSSLEIGRLTLQDKATKTVEITLTTSAVQAGDKAVLTIDFSVADLDQIKLLTLCTSNSNCYLSHEDSFVKDMVGLGIAGKGDGSAVQVNSFTADTTQPKMSQFSLFDLDTGRLTLLFTEPVNVSTLSFTKLALRDARLTTSSSTTGYYMLTKAAECNSSYCKNDRVVIFQLHSDDLNNIKSKRNLCTKDSDCILTIEAVDFVMDMNDNSLQMYPSGSVTNLLETTLHKLEGDTTSPTLTQFDLNLFNNTLTLVFDESVSATTLSADGLTIQGRRSATDASLQESLSTDSKSTSADGTTIIVTLSLSDAEKLKVSTSLATKKDDTFIAIASKAIKDMSDNVVTVISNTDALQVRQFIEDTSPAVVSEFTLDLNSNSLTLTYDEPVKVSTVDYARFSLQSSSTGGVSEKLSGSTTSTNGTVREVVVDLSEIVLVNLKSNSSIATAESNTYLTHESTAFKNYLDLGSDALIIGKQVTTYISDTTGPSLSKFSLDMNSGVMTLTFNDVVQFATLKVDQITLQHAITSATDKRVSLTAKSKSTTSEDGFNIVISLNESDLNSLKKTAGLATKEGDTFVTITASLIDGVDSFDVNAVTDGRGQQVDVYTADSTKPVLRNFDLDLDGSLLKLTFDEPVEKNSFNSNFVTIQKSSNNPGTDLRTLTGGTVTTSSDSTVVHVSLLLADVNAILQNPNLAVDADSTFLTFKAGLATDTAGNSINALTAGKQVQESTKDGTAPALTSFSLNLNMALLSLTFSELVKGLDLVVTSLTIQDKAVSPSNTQALTAATTTPTDDSDVLTLTVGEVDFNAIRANAGLATSNSNTFMTLKAGAIEDLSGNKGEAQEDTAVAGTVDDDITKPVLRDFSYDLSDNVLTLTFSEVVNKSSVAVSSFTVQSKANNRDSSSLKRTLTVSSSVSTPGNSEIIAIQLGSADVDFVTSRDNFLNSKETTFLSFTNGAVSDMSDNQVDGIADTAGKQVTTFLPDTKGPSVSSFDLDMDEGQLILTFSERVNPATLDAKKVSFANAGKSTVVHRLTGGSTTSVEDKIIIVDIIKADLNALKGNNQLVTSRSNSFLLMDSGVINDVENRRAIAIADGSAIQVTNYTKDSTGPQLESFELKMTGGIPPLILELTFDETVDVNTLTATEFTLQAAANASGSDLITLTGGALSEVNAASVEITVTATDLATIRSKSPLGANVPNTFLSLSSSAVKDMVGTNVQAIQNTAAKQATTITADLLKPTLKNFTLDMNTGEIKLTYSENIDGATFLSTTVTLHNSTNPSVLPLLKLTGTASSTSTGTVAEISLTDGDLNSLKKETTLGTTTTNTFITVTGGSIEDVAGNDAEAKTALRAGLVVADKMSPSLVSFDLDMNSNTLILTFDETVDASTLKGDQFTLQNAASSATQSYTLSDGSSNSTDGTTVKFVIQTTDINAVKEKDGLAIDKATTYLVIKPDAILDMSGNKVIERTILNGEQVETYTDDKTKPQLSSFDLDLDASQLTLSFDETVDSSSLIVTRLTLQNAVTRTVSHTLTTSTVLPGNKAAIKIDFSDGDLDEIKLAEMCVLLDDCYLTLEDSAVTDVVGEGIAEVRDGSAKQASSLISDSTLPKISSDRGFSEFDLNSGRFTLSFTEPVNTDSINFTKLAFRDARLTPQGDPGYFRLMESGVCDPAFCSNGEKLCFRLSRMISTTLKPRRFCVPRTLIVF